MTYREHGVPLRISLVALTLVLVVLGLAASGIAVTSAMERDLISRTDTGLRAAIETWAKPRAQNPMPGPPVGPRRPPSRYYALTTLIDGTTLGNNDFDKTPDVRGLPAQSGPVTVPSADGGHSQWRLIKMTNSLGESIVATPLDDVDATVSRLTWLLIGIGTVVVLVIWVLSYLLVRNSLRPLRRVEETAHAIAAGNLNMRVPRSPSNTEVGSLASSLNTMLGQIQRAFATTAESERQARRSEEEMRRFVADASHELRTPLTSIKGFAELYRQGAVPDAADAMRRIDAEAQRMGLLVEDLLMLARLDAQRPLADAPVDVLALAAEVVHSATVSAPQRDIRFEVDAPEEPPMVSGDGARLHQVIGNLVANALSHTPPEASITVRVAVDGDEVVIEVADTGRGLDADEATHVFERFYRGDASRQRDDARSGSGLGLSIVAALVEAHGGTVGVESEPDAGCTFWVRLPRLTG